MPDPTDAELVRWVAERMKLCIHDWRLGACDDFLCILCDAVTDPPQPDAFNPLAPGREGCADFGEVWKWLTGSKALGETWINLSLFCDGSGHVEIERQGVGYGPPPDVTVALVDFENGDPRRALLLALWRAGNEQ